MENKNKLILKILKYGILFLFFLYSLTISYNIFFGDTIVNYGFSYAISKGEIPYNDFNLIIPLFSPLLYSLSLIFTKNIISYFIMQSILLVVLFEVLEKFISKKVYILLPLTVIGYPLCLFSIFFPGYNFILLFLIIIMMFLENRNSNDYLIGFIIGLSIITKHTIGIFLILPSLIYINKNYHKILKRLLGLLIPCCLFLIYLIFTKSFNNFFNLCFMGLFDFAKTNFYLKNKTTLIILLIGIIYLVYSIFKRKNDINNYYILISLLFIYPLIDDYHLSHFIFLELILLLTNLKLNINNKFLVKSSLIFTSLFTIIWTFIVFYYGDYKFINFPNYPLRYINNSDYKTYKELKKYIEKNNKSIILFSIGTENYFYKITNNLDITYFDLPNYGNYGYDSYNMMIKKFNKLNDTIILINKNTLKNKEQQQFYKELANYVVNNYQEIGKLSRYNIYYKE